MPPDVMVAMFEACSSKKAGAQRIGPLHLRKCVPRTGWRTLPS